MTILIATVSILTITALAWGVKKISRFRVCPICAGVSGTWIWMLAAVFLGYEIGSVVPAMLLGGTVVGLAYQLEKWLPNNSSPFLWKTVFIPLGFISAYGLVTFSWPLFVTTMVALVTLAFMFLKKRKAVPGKPNETIEKLEEKMKNCC